MLWQRRGAVVAGLALALLSACGGSKDASVSSQGTPTAAPSSTTATTGVPTPTTTIGAPGTRPATTPPPKPTPTPVTTDQPGSGATVSGEDLRRRDVPPAGVAAQLTYLLPTDAPCAVDDPTPAVEPKPSSLYRIGDSVRICISGFDPGPPVSVEVSLPNGQTRQRSLVNVEGGNTWYFDVGPADPTGSYGITAVQGAAQAPGGFIVELPREPLIQTLDPKEGPPGTEFRFVVIGSSPGQTVPIDLYRGEGGSFVYATTLGSVATDGEARDSFQLTTGDDAAPARYCLLARPSGGSAPANSCATFVIR